MEMSIYVDDADRSVRMKEVRIKRKRGRGEASFL